MTDPRINPAGSPGPGSPGSAGGASPPEGGSQAPRHGLFHRGRSGSDPARTGASSVGTDTRTTASTSVPQQAGQMPSAAAGPAREYGGTEYASGESMYGGTSESQNLIARAGRMSWMALMLGALVMIGLGIALLVWPNASLTVVAVLIGCALVISGAVRLYEGFTARGGESGGLRTAYIVLGLVAVIAGLYCLRHHSLSLFLVAFVAGVYFVMHGVADIGSAVSSPGPGRGLRITMGVFAIAAGLILVIWPGISLVLLLTITAAWLLFYGVVLGGLAFRLRRAAKASTQSTATTRAAPARAA